MCVNEDQDAAHEPWHTEYSDKQHASLATATRCKRERSKQYGCGRAERYHRDAEQPVTKPMHRLRV